MNAETSKRVLDGLLVLYLGVRRASDRCEVAARAYEEAKAALANARWKRDQEILSLGRLAETVEIRDLTENS